VLADQRLLVVAVEAERRVVPARSGLIGGGPPSPVTGMDRHRAGLAARSGGGPMELVEGGDGVFALAEPAEEPLDGRRRGIGGPLEAPPPEEERHVAAEDLVRRRLATGIGQP